MPIMFYKGKILFVNGKIAMDPKCCCKQEEEEWCGCNKGTRPNAYIMDISGLTCPDLPSNLTLILNLEAPTGCSYLVVEDINGKHIVASLELHGMGTSVVWFNVWYYGSWVGWFELGGNCLERPVFTFQAGYDCARDVSVTLIPIR